jgi:hypothetical protein
VNALAFWSGDLVDEAAKDEAQLWIGFELKY